MAEGARVTEFFITKYPNLKEFFLTKYPNQKYFFFFFCGEGGGCWD